MVNKKFALVVPNNRLLRKEFCESYFRNFVNYKHDLSNILLIVVDDYSPFLNENQKVLESCGIPFEYWTIDSQINFFKDNFGSNWEKYWSVIPHRTDACRSFGYIIAALWGADVIITLDDDNYAINNDNLIPDYDYLGCHDVVSSEVSSLEVSSTSKWFNTIALLKTEPEKNLYARGYPYSRRYGELKYNKCNCRVVMNVGLWINNPDVDSITVLSEGSINGLPKTRTVGFKSNLKRVVLAKGTYAPLNTANTAYSRELLPVIYDTFQGAKVGELKLDRFGDIWCNLFIQKVLEGIGRGRIMIGLPLVEHRREPRYTFIDFKKEFWGIIWSEKLFEVIEKIHIRSKSYTDAYIKLIDNLREKFHKNVDIPSLRKYFTKLFNSMERWIELLEKLGLIN